MKTRGGYSLLEVILAMAILFGTTAMLGELGRLALRNAQMARDTTQAQLLCEGKLAEIAAGALPLQSMPSTQFEEVVGDGDVDWLYSIEVEQIDEDGLAAVRVTVAQELPEAQRLPPFSLTRWVFVSATDASEPPSGETDSEGGESR